MQKQNYPGLVAFYDTRPGNEVGLLYNVHEPTRGDKINNYHDYTTTQHVTGVLKDTSKPTD